MKKEELKEKAKGFLERNNLAIGAGVIALTGYVFGYKMCLKNIGIKPEYLIVKDENLIHVILDAQKKYGGDPGNLTMFWQVFESGLKPENFGELKTAFDAVNTRTDPTLKNEFTHFIAFGPTK